MRGGVELDLQFPAVVEGVENRVAATMWLSRASRYLANRSFLKLQLLKLIAPQAGPRSGAMPSSAPRKSAARLLFFPVAQLLLCTLTYWCPSQLEAATAWAVRFEEHCDVSDFAIQRSQV